MANAYSTSDLLKGALQNAGELPDGTSQYHSLTLKYLNDAYHGILSGSNVIAPEIGDAWVWARSSASLKLLPFNQTGNVTLTADSTAGTFASAPSLSAAGWFIQVQGTQFPTWYQIDTHTAATTSLTLKTVFVDPTTTSPFISCPLIYDLNAALPSGNLGILRLVAPFQIYVDRQIENQEDSDDTGRIYELDIDKFREIWPLRALKNDVPSRFATLTRSDTSWQVQMNKYVTYATKVDFEYIGIQPDLIDSDQSIPLFPREFRKVLENYAAHRLCIDKGMDKAEYFMGLAKAGLMAMHLAEWKNVEVGNRTFGRLTARPDQLSGRIKI